MMNLKNGTFILFSFLVSHFICIVFIVSFQLGTTPIFSHRAMPHPIRKKKQKQTKNDGWTNEWENNGRKMEWNRIEWEKICQLQLGFFFLSGVNLIQNENRWHLHRLSEQVREHSAVFAIQISLTFSTQFVCSFLLLQLKVLFYRQSNWQVVGGELKPFSWKMDEKKTKNSSCTSLADGFRAWMLFKLIKKKKKRPHKEWVITLKN